MKYAVILPTLNEAENINDMVRALLALEEPPDEIRIVDDHSPDGTFLVAEKLSTEYPGKVFPMMNPFCQSLSSSVVAGFDASDADFLLCMDADGQHRVCDVPKLVQALVNGNDMAIGSRYAVGGGFTQKWNAFRVLMSRTAAFMAFAVLHVKVMDPMSGFFAVRQDAFQKIRPALSPNGFKIMLEILYLLGLAGGVKILECGIVFDLRKRGKSKLSAKTIRQYLVMLVQLFFRRKSLKKRLSAGNV